MSELGSVKITMDDICMAPKLLNEIHQYVDKCKRGAKKSSLQATVFSTINMSLSLLIVVGSLASGFVQQYSIEYGDQLGSGISYAISGIATITLIFKLSKRGIDRKRVSVIYSKLKRMGTELLSEKIDESDRRNRLKKIEALYDDFHLLEFEKSIELDNV